MRINLFPSHDTGSIAEWVVPFDEQLVMGWHERRLEARGQRVPEVPFEGTPESQFLRGKQVDANWFQYGDPSPRTNEKGAVYGWDVLTGRTMVPTICTYCDFRSAHCWTDAVMEMDGNKPVWVVPTQVISQA